jgi:hypothetical protein
MDVRPLLVVVRDVSTLALGLAGVIHEEFYTSSQRPALIGLYGVLLLGLAYVKGRKLVQVLSRLAAEDEDEPAGSTTGPGTSGSRSPPRRSRSSR